MTLSTITPHSSVIFLGSGFSLNASNIKQTSIPGALQLEEFIASLLKLPAKKHRLSTLASHAIKTEPHALYDLLYNNFTCAKPTSDQESIINRPWLRLYTTNYDDVAEVIHQRSDRHLDSFTLNDKRPSKIRDGSIIHLHGSVRELSPDNLATQIVLSDEAYAGQIAVKSRWFDDFLQDIRYSEACFFVGYSASDHHIAALLLEDPTLTTKLYFIVEPDPDPLVEGQLADKGIVLSIGLPGFVELLNTLPSSEPRTIHSIRALRLLDARPPQAAVKPTAIEISNLFRYGNFHYGRCAGTLPHAHYVTPRKRLLDEMLSKLQTSRALILHSRLGNGKTILSDIFAIILAQQGYTCFRYRGHSRITEAELRTLAALDKLLVIFDSALDAGDFISTISNRVPRAKILVCYRTGLFDVRFEEIQESTPKPFSIVDLNRLDEEDISDLISIARGSGLQDLLPILEDRRPPREFRDLLIKAYESRHIIQQIQSMMDRAFSDRRTKMLIICAVLLKRADMRIEPHLLRRVSGSDVYSAITKGDEFLREVLASDDDGIAVRSAIFSEFVLKRFVNSLDILDVAFELTLVAQERREQEKYRMLSGWLMQYSNLTAIAGSDSPGFRLIGSHYERLRLEDEVNKEPLFWLQYAIFMVEQGDLVRANEFIDAAYARAVAFPGFKTFQIDTQAFRIRTMTAIQSHEILDEKQIEELLRRLEQMRNMVESTSHRYFVVRVLSLVRPFLERRTKELELRHKNMFVFYLRGIERALGALPPRVRATTGSDSVRADLEVAIKGLLRAE